jgi:hypothetical protein
MNKSFYVYGIIRSCISREGRAGHSGDLEMVWRLNNHLSFGGENLVKKAVITVWLLPETSKLSKEELISEIENEIKKAIYVIPWADQLESIEIQEANQPKENEDYEALARLRKLSETLGPKNLFRKPEDTK